MPQRAGMRKIDPKNGHVCDWSRTSTAPTQAEVQALRDKVEELARDVRALATLVHALGTATVPVGMLMRGEQGILDH